MRQVRASATRLVLVGFTVALAATRAPAQLSPTGQDLLIGPVGCAGGAILCDTRWTVRYETTGLLPGAFGNGAFQRAALVTTIPSPPFAPNVVGARQWIGATATGTLPANDATGAANYRYFFQTEYDGAATTLQFGSGWADRLVGVFGGPLLVGANGTFSGGTSLLDVSPYAARGGFCRDADGVLPASVFPDCTVNFTLAGVLAPTLLTVVVEGDGTADAFFVGAPRTTATVPEPSAAALLAGALVVGAGVTARRRGALR